jgi:hypothetical protein
VSRYFHTGVAAVVVLVIAVFAANASATARIDRGKFNYNTHAYIKQTRGCLAVTALVGQIIQQTKDVIEIADATTKARDTCDAIRSRLLRIGTDHFDHQASQAWYGVDRMKSGLNALLNYLDTSAPSKLIEARDKLVNGAATARAGIRAINARRRAYGLRAI